ncbi:PadR family transcriptional regulator [Candidatus Desulforudis audaxviator]|uniref:Transcriptional regulator, PadR-like family n=1 Tax=Desulforudis audaxviator (strain MP104C) TaxID=477974 RepID=B1I0V4_DESAP|nr:PadR family transcriptional regulator [Candidatus Desulforudis audaxviator]ACA58872.1 transcriptional regulator, PadR-like family [Candidatus Desulforudis audaxviator MP104C]AZK58886.1 Transcriptional regulator, PadR family [Candidatus Desulforudis audaxviator]
MNAGPNRPPEAELALLLQTHTEKLIWPCLLFLLYRKPAHGYELIQSLNRMDLPEGEADPATIYRNLRRMEEEELVTSRWEAGPSGPARRLYHLTPAGKQALHLFAHLLREKKEKMEQFLRQYRELFPAGPAENGKEGE